MKTRGNSTSELRTSVTHRQVNFTSWWVAPDGWCHASRGSVVMTSECNTSLQFHREYFCFKYAFCRITQNTHIPAVLVWRWWWWWWCWNNIEACNMHRLRATWILSSVTLHAQPTSVILCGAWVPATASSKGTSLSSTLKKKLRKKLTIDLKYPPKIANNSKPKYIKHEGGKWQF